MLLLLRKLSGTVYEIFSTCIFYKQTDFVMSVIETFVNETFGSLLVWWAQVLHSMEVYPLWFQWRKKKKKESPEKILKIQFALLIPVISYTALFFQIIPASDPLAPCACDQTHDPLLNGPSTARKYMDPWWFLTFADGKEQSREREWERKREREVNKGQADKKADGSNSSTVLWATGRRNVLIFEGCKTFVCPQCLKRNPIPALTTKAAFDKSWEKSGEYYTFSSSLLLG